MKWYHIEGWDSRAQREIGGYLCAHTAEDAVTMFKTNVCRNEPGRYIMSIRCISTKEGKARSQ